MLMVSIQVRDLPCVMVSIQVRDLPCVMVSIQVRDLPCANGYYSGTGSSLC